MKTIDRKDAIYRGQDERRIIVKTAIHRVSCLKRTVFVYSFIFLWID
ncbi:MAG: hypothetical protein V7L11_21045 [Nostoc sp.]